MTDQEVRKLILETSILNDLLELRLKVLEKQPIGHKSLEKVYNRLLKATQSTTKVHDKKFGYDKAEMFGEMYDEINDLLTDIFNKIVT